MSGSPASPPTPPASTNRLERTETGDGAKRAALGRPHIRSPGGRLASTGRCESYTRLCLGPAGVGENLTARRAPPCGIAQIAALSQDHWVLIIALTSDRPHHINHALLGASHQVLWTGAATLNGT